MDNFTVEVIDLSKERNNKKLYLKGSNYNSFLVLTAEGTAEIGFSRNGDKLKLNDDVTKMIGLESFDEIYLTHKAQEGKKIRILFGQNLGTDTLEAFTELAEFGVDVKSTPAVQPGDLNLDSDKNLGVDVKSSPDLKPEDLNLDPDKNIGVILETDDLQTIKDNQDTMINKQDTMIGLLEEIRDNTAN